MDTDTILSAYCPAVFALFGERIVFLGLQGSRARGEETDASDTDFVLILDKLTAKDLSDYRNLCSALPQGAKLCGFVCGKEELLGWEKSDLLSVYLDTVPLSGGLPEQSFSQEDKRRAVRSSACSLYHFCCHSYLFSNTAEAVKSARKALFFTLRLRHYALTGEFLQKQSELLAILPLSEQALFSEASAEDVLTEIASFAGSLLTRFA